MYLHRAIEHALGEAYEECIADLDEAIALDSAFGSAYQVRAECRYWLEDQDGAVADMRSALPLAKSAS